MRDVLSRRERDTASRILLAASAAGLGVALFDYFWRGNGIHGTPGALLVVVSTALMVAAAAALVFAKDMGASLRGTLLVLIALDIIGTGLAAWLLEAYWLIAAMVLALIGWIIHLTSGRVPRRRPGSATATQRTAG